MIGIKDITGNLTAMGIEVDPQSYQVLLETMSGPSETAVAAMDKLGMLIANGAPTRNRILLAGDGWADELNRMTTDPLSRHAMKALVRTTVEAMETSDENSG